MLERDHATTPLLRIDRFFGTLLAEIQEALAVFGMHLRDDPGLRGQQELPIDTDAFDVRRSDEEPLRTELRRLVESVCTDERDAAALARWLGLDGASGTSPRAAAKAHSIAVEALRGVRVAAQEKLRAQPSDAPALDRALGEIAATVPATLPRIVGVLRDAGLANAPFDPRGVLEAARLLGRRTGLVVEEGSPLIVTRRDLRGIHRAVEVACSLALAVRTVVAADDVLGSLSADHDRQVWRSLVDGIVGECEAYEWIDEERGRFAYTGLVESVASAVTTALAGQHEASLDDLRDALGEGTLDDGDLRCILADLPDLELDGDRVRRSATLEPERAPVLAEEPSISFSDLDEPARRRLLVEVLQARPETTLQELCEAEGPIGQWLRCTTIVDLALAAVHAGVRSSPTPPVPVASSPRDEALPEPSRPAKQPATGSNWSALSISVELRPTEPRQTK
jgi:hypothetical protein